MSFNVFFAWQMDTPTKLNRWFIESAIKSAIKKLRAEGQQQLQDELQLEPAPKIESDEPDEVNPEPDPADTEIVYQWGAHGHVGASMIAETILQRIEACGVFIADLTFTAIVRTADNREKKAPNSNVLIEVGAASRTGAGWDRMILVLNTAHGQVEELPFDLRHRQLQVRYTLSSWDDPDRSKKSKQLAEDIVDILRPMYHRALKNAAKQQQAALRIEQAALADMRARAELERNAYENKLVSQAYRSNFKATLGLLAITVIPAEPHAVPHQSDNYFYERRLAPINNNKGVLKHEMKSELSFWPSEDQPLNSVTELVLTSGSIYAVRNLLWNFSDPVKSMKGSVKFGFNAIEPQITDAVWRYVNTLKELSVNGPYFVGISLLNVRGFKIELGDWSGDNWFIGDNDPQSIQTDLLIMFPNVDTSNEETVADFLKPAFQQVWRAFHLPNRPNLRPDGTFSWET